MSVSQVVGHHVRELGQRGGGALQDGDATQCHVVAKLNLVAVPSRSALAPMKWPGSGWKPFAGDGVCVRRS